MRARTALYLVYFALMHAMRVRMRRLQLSTITQFGDLELAKLELRMHKATKHGCPG